MTRALCVLTVSVLLAGCALLPSARAPMAPPSDPLLSQLRAAIWFDIQSNALIGNGSELLMRWANAGDERNVQPLLHIQDLVCSEGSTWRVCQFGLLRDGGVAYWEDQPAPDRLLCRARFHRSGRDGGWMIPRLPPGPDGGHSRLSIRCRPVS